MPHRRRNRALGIVLAAILTGAAPAWAQTADPAPATGPTTVENAETAEDMEAAAEAFQAEFDETQALIQRMQERLEAINQVTGSRTRDLDYLDGKIGEAIEQMTGTLSLSGGALGTSGGADAALVEPGVGPDAGPAELRARIDELVTLLNIERRTTAVLKSERAALAEAVTASQDRQVAVEGEMAGIRSGYDSQLAAAEARVEELQASADQDSQTIRATVEEVDRLNGELAGLREEMAALQARLADREEQVAELEAEAADSGATTERLEPYRAEVLARLTAEFGDGPDRRVAGGRLIVQSDPLFDAASATLKPEGTAFLGRLAGIVADSLSGVPADIDWVLRIEAHTDGRSPAAEGFGSNWVLSSERALSVLNFLNAEGLPENRLSASAFGEARPLDPRRDEIADRRNRRIEFRLSEL